MILKFLVFFSGGGFGSRCSVAACLSCVLVILDMSVLRGGTVFTEGAETSAGAVAAVRTGV